MNDEVKRRLNSWSEMGHRIATMLAIGLLMWFGAKVVDISENQTNLETRLTILEKQEESSRLNREKLMETLGDIREKIARIEANQEYIRDYIKEK